jgi:prepilin-type N-terminal cleavage/methylation domain-containing protein
VTTSTGNLALRTCPRGFTLAELIIGLLLLVIIGATTAAVASSVSRGWQLGESKGASTLTINRTMLRVQNKVQRCKFMGQWRAGSVSSPNSVPGAALLFWRDDVNDDGLMQLDETEMLEYDPAEQTLVVWEMSYPNATARASNNGPFPTTMLTGATAIDDYKGMLYKARNVITKNVQGASFNVITPTTASQRATVEFQLKFDGPDGTTLQYGTAMPRSPIP